MSRRGKHGKVVKARERLARGNFTLPSPEEIKAAQSGNGGWTAMQLAEWGIPWEPPKGWRQQLESEYRALGCEAARL